MNNPILIRMLIIEKLQTIRNDWAKSQSLNQSTLNRRGTLETIRQLIQEIRQKGMIWSQLLKLNLNWKKN